MKKTYAECEQDVDRRLKDAIRNNPQEPGERIAFMIGFWKQLAAQMMFENELLRDQSNTAEMHQFLERLGGGEPKMLTPKEVSKALAK